MSGIPVVDLFAGPGGLGEGFSSIQDASGRDVFKIAVSIEKDAVAHRTLTLRAVYRFLKAHGGLRKYYAYVRGDIEEEEFKTDRLVKAAFAEAAKEARCAELGRHSVSEIDEWIEKAVSGKRRWVLIGGPPCQAYSLAGRSRRTNDQEFEKDEKHFLYKEYLRIIEKYEPPVFVMENVKGILSSKHGGTKIFTRILQDLSNPKPGLSYQIRSFVKPAEVSVKHPEYVIRSENFGVPQKRHRVILFGVRHDISISPHMTLEAEDENVSVADFLSDLPRVRSTLSRGKDSHEDWLGALLETTKVISAWKHEKDNAVLKRVEAALKRAERLKTNGGRFVPIKSSSKKKTRFAALKWVQDSLLGGASLHDARGHMASDLQRYLFAACYAKELGVSPTLPDFPKKLLPAHENAKKDYVPFEDRFRVQVGKLPASTVVSHIAKDGHYYIHYDAGQCRSLTVREAARLQTFPDNYFFEGNRTEQYAQVGNAVPPFLARQLAFIVADLLGAPMPPRMKKRQRRAVRR